MKRRLRIRRFAGTYAVHRLGPDAALPSEAAGAALFSATRTPDELSLVLPEGIDVPGARTQGGWACFGVVGPLDFSWTGIVASLATALAEAGIPVFVVSTFDTDWILVPADRAEAAAHAWRAAGHDAA